MKKASTLIRPGNWKSVFMVLFAWCLVGSINAQTTLDLSNDTGAYHSSTGFVVCGDHDGTASLTAGTYTDGAGLYPDDYDDNGYTGMIFWTFCPDDAATQRVRLTFSEFDIVDADDAFRIFNGDCGDRGFGNVTLLGPSVGSAAATPSGTAPDYGTGWAEATCENGSGCLTVGFNPDGDGNKGNGFEFTTTNVSIAPEISCPSYANVSAACDGVATVTILSPVSENTCTAEGIASGVYTIGVAIDGISGSTGTANLGVGQHTVTYTLNLGDNVLQTLSCTFIVSDEADLVCNDHVNVSLGNDCSTAITPDDIIESDVAPVYPVTISIDGGTHTAGSANALFSGLSLSEGTYTYRLTDNCGNAGNVCTGSISLADLQGPLCPGNTVEFVLCGSAPDAEAPNFLDCSDIAETSHDDLFFGSCSNFTQAERDALFAFGYGEQTWWVETATGSGVFQIPAIQGGMDFVESVTVRSWKAVDAVGNTSEGCLQIFVNVRPNQLTAPGVSTITLGCDDGTSPDELIAMDQFSGEDIVPQFTVDIPGNFSPLTGSGADIIGATGFVLPGDHSVCGWITSFEDQEIEACGNSRKIIRNWTWLDWCNPSPNISGSTQIIEIVDDVEPTLVVESAPGAMIRSVGHFECQADVSLDPATWTDACGDIASFRSEIRAVNSDGSVGSVLWSNNQNGGDFANIAVGSYFVRYYATDACGNETSDPDGDVDSDWNPIPANVHTTTLSVIDDVRPQPQCDDNINISLGSDWGRIDVAAVDEGSYDNCGIASMGISLSESGPFEETLQVQCEDVHELLKVYLEVTDNSGNTNLCWGNVFVEDKIAPVCDAPADMTVFCDVAHFNIPDGEVTGTAAADLNTRFGAPSCVDNITCVDLGITQTVKVNGDGCGKYTVERTWVATDWNSSSAPVTQTITVEYRPGWTITVPEDVDVNCEQEQAGPSFSFGEDDISVISGSCDQLGVEVDSREFIANDGACKKLEVTYHIINWCIYQPGDVAVALPRSSTGGSATFSSADFATASYMTYTRIMRLVDDVAPVVQDIAHDGLCINGSDCTDTATWTAWGEDCVPEDDMTWTSVVYETDAQGNILATVDTGDDYTITVDIENKKYYVAEFWAADGCGNSAGAKSDPEQAWDCKAPTPYALNGVSINLSPSGTAEIWASDIDQGSYDECGAVSIGIRQAGDGAPTTAAEAAAVGTSIEFTCNDLGTQLIELYAIDSEGNYSFVETYVIVQDNSNACMGGVIDVEEEQSVAGKITNPDGELVQTVNVSVNGGMSTAMTTGNAGAYGFTVPTGGDYTITPEKDINHLNGVSTFDLVLISKHILNIQNFTSPYEYIAADINKSGTITAFDMVQLRQLILNINTEFASNTSWRFVDAAYNFGPLATTLSQNFPEIANINNIVSDQINVNFIAVKIGDINGSALASSLVSAESRNANGTLVLTTEDRSVAKGEQVSVSFTAADIASVEGYQFTMNYAGLDLTQVVEGVAKAANFNNVRGALATSWNGQATATDVLFTTEFTATADGLLSELISVSSDVTAAEAYNTAGELLDIAIEFTATPAANFELMQNTPNPFNAETVIGFNLPTAGTATLKVMDIQGKVLKAITADYAKGYNQISLNAKELGATGVLSYQLESASNVVTKKMIIID